VWNQAHQLTPEIEPATASFPHEKSYRRRSQIRRAARRFARTWLKAAEEAMTRNWLASARSLASSSELEYHLLLALDLLFSLKADR
jgi:four helix bundle protein